MMYRYLCTYLTLVLPSLTSIMYTSWQWRISDSIKGGAKFSLATSAYTRGPNHVLLFFPMPKTDFFAKGGHGPMPPKYATASWLMLAFTVFHYNNEIDSLML